ncbi:TIR-like protein FxsC [Plantactinospora siamensis]|uniref:TIR-like protein FxsC n=1 Tax=Plantactinospora siamensis TaxID=555372 RepID=A0ABV6P115_9ACTN
MLYFFLSYARGDDDVFVEEFYRDLSREVRVRAGLDRGQEVGFVDMHSIELGAAWSERLVSALSTCRSFIALCGPRYFTSEACGREWHVFASRAERYERDTGQPSSALLPILWLPPRRMPEVASALQYDSDVLGEAYRKTGLRQLLRLQRNREAYIDFVDALADRIVETADTHELPQPEELPQFDEIPNAFRSVPGGRRALPTPPSSPERGPDRGDTLSVQFVVAAGSTDEMRSIRASLDYHGARPVDWAPYQPTMSQPLGEYAVAVATRRSFAAAVADLAELGPSAEVASQENRILVLLVDPWATRVDQARLALLKYDQQDREPRTPASAVMIPASHDDSETQLHWRELSDSLRAIFASRVARADDVMFRTSILTHQAFESDLQVVLEVAVNRLFVEGRVHRRPSGDTAGGWPQLQSP